MSELEQEQDAGIFEDQQPDETPAEETGDVQEGEGGETGDEPDEQPDDEPDDEPGEESDGEPSGSALDEKEIERRQQKLENENVRHAKRLGDIMGDDATALIPCPVCMDGIAGWIYPPDAAPLNPDQVSRIRTVIGLPDYTTFRQADDATTCPACDGLGETITGSHVPGYETKTCSRCNKTGYILTGQHVERVNGAAEPAPVLTGPTVVGEPANDPEIQHLRERGFTVIPPLQPVRAG